MHFIAQKAKFVCVLLTVILSGSLFGGLVFADDEPKTVPAGEVCERTPSPQTMTSTDVIPSGTALMFTSRSRHNEHALLHSPNPRACAGTLHPHTMRELKTQSRPRRYRQPSGIK
jgi:hypothetical protein